MVLQSDGNSWVLGIDWCYNHIDGKVIDGQNNLKISPYFILILKNIVNPFK